MSAEKSWYEQEMGRVMADVPTATADAKLLARSIMTAGAFIADMVRESFIEQHSVDSVQSALRDIADAVDHYTGRG